jgi:nitrate/TMAO reductase-like tetraheme cytochrome c subunit
LANESQEPETEHPRRVRHLWLNPVSLVGFVLAAVSLVFFLSLQFFELISTVVNPYLAIWSWLVFAPMFVVGGLLMPIGVFITRWYWLRNNVNVSDIIRYPRIELSNDLHRKVVVGVGLITVIMIPLIGLASAKTVHYSSSSNFCGNGCHNVMGPQYTRYLHSPHARVECADCHIGSGTSSLIKAKVNGLRQVISLVLNSYARPIPAAGVSLRPAKETCEECHWASKYYGDRYFEKYNYKSDELNTRRETKMILKVGGGDPQAGPVGGIHWHMSLGYEIDYSATRKDLQEIPWVRVRDLKTAESRVYRSDGLKGDEPPAKGIFRKLDCLDCHNRGAHKVESPVHLVDVALETGAVDKALPYIKREAVAAMVGPYANNDEGLQKIPERLNTFYRENYPDIAISKTELLKSSIDQVLTIYKENFFAGMNVDWRSYPDNLDHKTFPGCFRCHDDKHVSTAGKKITAECTTCHDFISSVNANGETVSGEFQHSIVLGKGMHANVTCRQCHTGGVEPAKKCDGACHLAQKQLISGDSPALKRFDIEADAMNGEVDCDECHIAERPVSVENVVKECKSCHEADEKDYGETLAKWVDKLGSERTAVDDALNKLGAVLGSHTDETPAVKTARQWLTEANVALAELSKSGPLHNFKASKNVYKTIIEEAQEQIEAISKVK